MKSIGKYQVIEQLGTSAAGTTYRVRDSFRNREFALKLLQTVPALASAAKEQLCAHLAACAELAHRHVVKIQDLGEVEEGLFIVSEWRTGVDFARFKEENQQLPLGQKLALIAQIAEGLAFAHSREIAHGNLKPSNVFVDGERDITLLDFGVAKWVAALIAAGARPEGLVVNYLAPEQILGEPFDARSDIFALGLMLYEFATGTHPFAAPAGLIPREIVHREPEPLRKLDPQIPQELDQLVLRALKKDPAERLQTAEEFAAGLYVAAQELRRRAAFEAHTQPTTPPATPPPPAPVQVAPPPASPILATPPPPPVPEPPQLPQMPLAPPAFAPFATAEPPVRERPQDKPVAPQPWTARSYSASVPLVKETPPLPQPAFIVVEPSPQQNPPLPPPAAPRRAPSAPQPLRTMAPNKSKLVRQLVPVLAGLIVAIGIIGSVISHQRARASENKVVAPPVQVTPSATSQPLPPEHTIPKSAGAEAKPGEAAPHPTLSGIRSLWESGRYSEALALVNQALAEDPDNTQALVWKKKIRDAQEAEAALK